MSKTYTANKMRDIKVSIEIPGESDGKKYACVVSTKGFGVGTGEMSVPKQADLVLVGENKLTPQDIMEAVKKHDWNKTVPEKVNYIFKQILNEDPTI